MSKELNIFNNKDIQSFGGKTLKVNLERAETAIAGLEDDFRIHNHGNTQFSWQHFVLSHKGGLRNARQVTAEISQKRMALNEAKHNHARKVIEIELLQEMLDGGNCNQHPRLVQADIEKLTDDIKMSLPPIEGAIKDILILKNVYDQIAEAKQGYSEQDLERDEVDYWIRRIFSQALRDIRQSGVIMSGNQEAIEQMGLNISRVADDLLRYLDKESEAKSLGNDYLVQFLDASCKKYAATINSFIGYGGFKTDVLSDF